MCDGGGGDNTPQVQSHDDAVTTAALGQVLSTLPGPADTSRLHCQDATSGPEGAVMSRYEAGLYLLLWSPL